MKREVTTEIGRETADEAFVMPRKANDIIADSLAVKPLPPLLDGLWQPGEVALAFGAAGIGVSLFANTVVDALARGRPIEGFNMPTRRHKVLYVDLVLSDVQFQRRYTPVRHGKPGRPLRFADNFRRARPAHDEDLCAWVRKMVRLGGFEVVVIDDLSAVMRTDDGTFDSLRIMREMKRLSQETGVSVLMLADSTPSPRHDISERDLRRSHILCSVADSVFGIGEAGRGRLKLVQFRSQGSAVRWGPLSPIRCLVTSGPGGVPMFKFDERHVPKPDIVRSMLICRVNKLRGEGKTFREIAAQMNITKSRAERLFQSWTPAVHEMVHGPDSGLDRYGYSDEYEADDDYESEDNVEETGPEYSDNNGETGLAANEDDDREDEIGDRGFEYEMIADIEADTARAASPRDTRHTRPPEERYAPGNIPFASALGRRRIYDLERRTDAYGHEIFVEKANERTGKPAVWYKQDRHRHFSRYERDAAGIDVQNIGLSGFVPGRRIAVGFSWMSGLERKVLSFSARSG